MFDMSYYLGNEQQHADMYIGSQQECSPVTSEQQAYQFNLQSVQQQNTSPNTQQTVFTFTNYSGQVPEPHLNPAQMNFTDSGAGVMQPPPPSMSPSPMSAIPSNTHYTGGYNFKLDIGKQTKDTKATAWTFSPGMNKLYAQKDAMVPVRFSIACDGVANGLFIRALPVYSRPEHLSDVVKRCPYHSQSPESANIPHREHFIWCENQGASYVQDQQTGRYAAVMPYDTPPAGTEWVTYLFSFKCLNSCVGGPNRREMSIIFTLEDANAQVLGRLCVDLRICACPGRDRKSDENKMNTSTAASTPTMPASTTSQAGHSSASNTPVSTSGPTHSQTNKTEPATPLNHTACEREMYAVSKRSRNDSSCETFSLTVRGKKNYELLSRIRDSLEMTEQLVPHGERDRYVQQRRQNDAQHQHRANTQQPQQLPKQPQQQHQVSSQRQPLQFSQHQPLQQQHQPLPRISSGFTFSSVGPFSRQPKSDLIDSTNRGTDMTDSAAGPTPPLASPSVADWLRTLGLGAYIDDFHSAGIHSMDQLKSEQNFTIMDLENMKLTKPTVTQIWNSLKGYRLAVNPLPSRDGSASSVVSLMPAARETVTLPDSQGSKSPPSQRVGSQGVSSQGSRTSLTSSGLFNPGLMEITRCSMKFTVTRKTKRRSPSSEIASSTDETTSSKKARPDKDADNDSSSV